MNARDCGGGLHQITMLSMFFFPDLLTLATLFAPTSILVQAPDVTAELFVEVLGCLANLYIPEFDFFGLVRKHDLLQFLAQYAQPGAGETDVCVGGGWVGVWFHVVGHAWPAVWGSGEQQG